MVYRNFPRGSFLANQNYKMHSDQSNVVFEGTDFMNKMLPKILSGREYRVIHHQVTYGLM